MEAVLSLHGEEAIILRRSNDGMRCKAEPEDSYTMKSLRRRETLLTMASLETGACECIQHVLVIDRIAIELAIGSAACGLLQCWATRNHREAQGLTPGKAWRK